MADPSTLLADARAELTRWHDNAGPSTPSGEARLFNALVLLARAVEALAATATTAPSPTSRLPSTPAPEA